MSDEFRFWLDGSQLVGPLLHVQRGIVESGLEVSASSLVIARLFDEYQSEGTKMGKLTGKVAVVTGASKGIGAAIAKELAAEGASVVVNYASSKEGAEKVVGEITEAGGQARAVGGSVARPDEITKLFAETKKA